MLTAIIDELKNHHQPVSLRSISQKLGLDESTVEGMMQTLVNKGIVHDHSHDMDTMSLCSHGSPCSHCPIKFCSIKYFPKLYSLRTH